MDRRQLQDKFRGTLVGVAVGDALGAGFEGSRVVDRARLEALKRQPGPLRYTDDTHMTIGMAESLLACRGFDGAHMAALFARRFAAEPWRGYGAGPPQVFRLLQQGVPWDQAARRLFGGAGSFGNGAAMRVAPAALFAWHDLQQVAELARQTARLTHAHALGVAGAVLQACAIAWLLPRPPGSPLDPGACLAALRGLVAEPLYGEKLAAIQDLLPAGGRDDVVRRLGHGIAAYEAVPAALYAFLRHADSFADAVLYAIGLGGDTDTIASMTGALAGAYLGEQAIPEVWRDGVEGAAYLRELAEALLAQAQSPGSCPAG